MKKKLLQNMKKEEIDISFRKRFFPLLTISLHHGDAREESFNSKSRT